MRVILGFFLAVYLSLAVYFVIQIRVSRPSILSSFVSVNHSGCGNIIGRHGDTYFALTAAHMLYKSPFPNVLSHLSSLRSLFCVPVYVNVEYDFAIVSFKNKLNTNLDVASMDFDYHVIDEITTIGTPHRIPYWIGKGTIGYANERIYVTAANCHGSSGGPLYNSSNRQIGLITALKVCTNYDEPPPITNMILCTSLKIVRSKIGEKNYLKYFGVKDEQF